MKTLKKVLKWITFTTLTVLVLAFGILIWAFNNPVQVYKIAEKNFFPEDLKITFSDVQFDSRFTIGLKFSMDWKIQDLHIQKEKPLIDISVQKIHLKGLAALLSRTAHVEILEIQAPQTWKLKSEKKEEKPKPVKNYFQQVQSVISLLEMVHKRVTYDNLDIELNEFQILGDSDPILVSADLSTDAETKIIQVTSQIKRSGHSNFFSSVDGKLDLGKMNKPEPFLQAKVSFEGFNIDVQQELEARFSDSKADLKSKGPIEFSNGKLKLMADPSIHLSMDAENSDLTLLSDVKGIPGPIPKVDNFLVRIQTPLEESIIWSEKPSNFSVQAPIELVFLQPKVKDSLQKSCECQLPLTIKAQAQGQLWLAALAVKPNKEEPVLDSKISVESMQNKLFSLDLAATIKIAREASRWKISPVLDSKAIVYRFQGLMPLMKAYNILIPAPLDVLDGRIDFMAQGPVERNEKGSRFPAVLKTDLVSSKQKVKLQTAADFLLSPDFKKMHIGTKAQIEDFQIELPPLNPIGGNPRITPDRRILKEPPPKNPNPKFQVSFDVEVSTQKPGGIRLISEFFKPYLPLTLNFQITNKAAREGFVRTEPFDIVYLRRKVRVEKMVLDLGKEEDEVIPVDGRLKIEQTHYTIFIDIQGNIAKPNITMTSEPYLPESEIISVLLYDRTSDQLISADAETAGGVQAAIADRAIGLFGLWAFASTPIRSFSYNPSTKVYTATVSLGDDLTAGIGTTWESTAQLELRKRVSKSWMLTASWTDATEEEQQNTRLVLQWEKRF